MNFSSLFQECTQEDLGLPLRTQLKYSLAEVDIYRFKHDFTAI